MQVSVFTLVLGYVEGHFPRWGGRGKWEGILDCICEFRLIVIIADPTEFIGLLCSDKYHYLICPFDLLLFLVY